MIRPVLAVAAVSTMLVGCTPSPSPSPPGAPSASSAPEPGASAMPVGSGWEGPWGRFHSKRHDTWMQLPNGATWKIDDHKSSWLVAKHPATSTVLRYKIYREEHAVNRDKCEAMARKEDPTLPREDETAIDRADSVLAGWDSHAFAIVTAGKKGQGPLVGQYLAWGANTRRCFVLHVTTTSEGPAAAREVGVRLADLPELTKKLSFEDATEGPGRLPVGP